MVTNPRCAYINIAKFVATALILGALVAILATDGSPRWAAGLVAALVVVGRIRCKHTVRRGQ